MPTCSLPDSVLQRIIQTPNVRNVVRYAQPPTQRHRHLSATACCPTSRPVLALGNGAVQGVLPPRIAPRLLLRVFARRLALPPRAPRGRSGSSAHADGGRVRPCRKNRGEAGPKTSFSPLPSSPSSDSPSACCFRSSCPPGAPPRHGPVNAARRARALGARRAPPTCSPSVDAPDLSDLSNRACAARPPARVTPRHAAAAAARGTVRGGRGAAAA
jgi:hypothetical protein